MDLNLNPHERRVLQELGDDALSPVPMLQRSMLVSAGISPGAIRALTESGDLVRRERGIYTAPLAGTPDPMVVRICAHNAAATGGSHVYSYTSAALIWGLSVWRCRPLVHVAHAGRRGDCGPNDDVVRHNQRIPETQIRIVNGLAVTSLERTILDCARMLPFELAVVIADSGLAHGADHLVLRQLVADAKGTRGIRRAREVLEAADGRSESPAETRLRLLLEEWNLPEPELQRWITTARGRERVDFAWVDRRVVIEVHGYAKYFDYGPPDAKVSAQQEREARLVAAGWRVLNIYWPELDDPVALRAKVRAFLTTPHALFPAA
ncbi:very-short-patch-repair endonuclease [Sinomonas atrocyanea]|uniref:type IV toxin-antitoxin system AbiEi family antitoxin domain-containing protein n=1 Tax=Sinomonas atrocyanea TaxID=37927 RepID=UPI002786FAFB|nr:type IV toxin-antitoxin system AbiEi family antitoxin domain-containing protein [Sinomonas atrocyanea]MDP9883738.1 very-short-patch-repair endonuclease [Sinomonas atrocyanea]